MIVISKHLFIQYTAETMSLDEKCPMTRQAEDKSYFSKEIKSININEKVLSTKKAQKFKEISELKDDESGMRNWV